MPNKKPILLAVMLTISIICLSACAGGLIIKTWYLDAKLGELLRRDAEGNIRERKALAEADGYRCYSPVDDEAWRKAYSDYKACCDANGGLSENADVLH